MQIKALADEVQRSAWPELFGFHLDLLARLDDRCSNARLERQMLLAVAITAVAAWRSAEMVEVRDLPGIPVLKMLQSQLVHSNQRHGPVRRSGAEGHLSRQ